MRCPSEFEQATDGGSDEIAIYEAYLEAGFRVGIPSIVVEASSFFGFCPSQLTPQTWRTLMAIQVLGEFHGFIVGVHEILYSYYFAPLVSKPGFYNFGLAMIPGSSPYPSFWRTVDVARPPPSSRSLDYFPPFSAKLLGDFCVGSFRSSIGRFLSVGVDGSLPYSEIWKIPLIGNLPFLGGGGCSWNRYRGTRYWDPERFWNGDPEIRILPGARRKMIPEYPSGRTAFQELIFWVLRPSTQTPVSSTDTRSPPSTEDTLPSTDIFLPTSIDTSVRTSIDAEPRDMVTTLILVRDDNGDLHDHEGHLRNAAEEPSRGIKGNYLFGDDWDKRYLLLKIPGSSPYPSFWRTVDVARPPPSSRSLDYFPPFSAKLFPLSAICLFLEVEAVPGTDTGVLDTGTQNVSGMGIQRSGSCLGLGGK
ncbi:hypothetical protein F2Q70_00002681 [Brassica cretica]|uniref:Uncharacterized protein n=1 Tax=Brassica cretica TaxID=69181 RepID=A0A8S9IM92_BRACR|nr:hypothetical protein F2Q70_00002681 [Brassica cretica]